MFYRELLTLILLPDWQEALSSDREDHLIPIPPEAIVVLLQPRLLHVTTLKAVGHAPLVERDDVRVELAHIERVEGVLEENHLGIRAVALTPILLIADEGSRRRRTVDTIDVMDAHDTNRCAVMQGDDENELTWLLLRQAIDPPHLVLFRLGVDAGQVLPHLRIVDPLGEEWSIRAMRRTQNGFLAFQKHDLVTHWQSSLKVKELLLNEN